MLLTSTLSHICDTTECINFQHYDATDAMPQLVYILKVITVLPRLHTFALKIRHYEATTVTPHPSTYKSKYIAHPNFYIL